MSDMDVAQIFGDVLVVEDEPPARDRLVRLLNDVAPKLKVVGTPGSVAQTAAWLDAHPEPGVILCDIELSDGSALSLFSGRVLGCPIVYITAYDRYVMEALDAGGVDYVLKPVKRERLLTALTKIARIAHRGVRTQPRIVVHQGAAVIAVECSDIAYFTVEHKMTLLVTFERKSYYLDRPLAALEDELQHHGFFRASRGFLLNRRAVTGYRRLPKGRLSVELEPAPHIPVTVSQPRAGAFRRFFAAEPPASLD